MKNSNQGFSLVEVMLAMSIMTASALILYGANADISKRISKIKITGHSKDIIGELINTYSNSASLLQVDSAPSATFPNVLPIAWDTDGKKMLLTDCGTPCLLKGRMAVIIVPTANKRLVMMKIRMTHEDWPNPKESSLILGTE